jgi:hypothetical protein
MAFFGLTALAGLETGGPFRANARSILNIRSKEDWIELHNLYQLYDMDNNGLIAVKELKVRARPRTLRNSRPRVARRVSR